MLVELFAAASQPGGAEMEFSEFWRMGKAL